MWHLSAAGLTHLPFLEVAAPDDRSRADKMPRVTVGLFLFSVESCVGLRSLHRKELGPCRDFAFDKKGGVFAADSLCDIWHHFQLMISFREPC